MSKDCLRHVAMILLPDCILISTINLSCIFRVTNTKSWLTLHGVASLSCTRISEMVDGNTNHLPQLRPWTSVQISEAVVDRNLRNHWGSFSVLLIEKLIMHFHTDDHQPPSEMVTRKAESKLPLDRFHIDSPSPPPPPPPCTENLWLVVNYWGSEWPFYPKPAKVISSLGMAWWEKVKGYLIPHHHLCDRDQTILSANSPGCDYMRSAIQILQRGSINKKQSRSKASVRRVCELMIILEDCLSVLLFSASTYTAH